MANYYILLTDYGMTFTANAQAGTQLALTHVVLGDANGQPYLPESRLNKTVLVNQRSKLPVASVTVINETTAEVTAIVPSNVGGFNVHEVGIADSSGKLVYVGNFHGGYRPTLTEGAGGDMELVFTIKADNLATVVIETDGTVVTATREWVSDRFALKSLVAELSDIIDQLKEELMATQWEVLSNRIKIIEDGIGDLINAQAYKVGDVYTTTLAHANADAVATHHGYGAWARYAEGRTLVGFSTQDDDTADYKTMGNEFGDDQVTLTDLQMPIHKHSHSDKYQYYMARHHKAASVDSGDYVQQATEWNTHGNDDADFAAALDEDRGGGNPHNNVQSSKVAGVWVRTA